MTAHEVDTARGGSPGGRFEMVAGRSPDPDAERDIAPLTERILRRLGRPRWLWIILWASVPLLSALVFSAAIRASGRELSTEEFVDLAATQLGLAYACLVLLLGTGLLSAQASAVRDELPRLVLHDAPGDPFRGITSAVGPIGLTAIVVGLVSIAGSATYGPLPPLVALAPLAIYLVPILTFVWVCAAILIGLHRFGRLPLALDRFPHERTLGLERLGGMASTGLALLLVAAAPVLLAGSDEPVTFGIGLAVVSAVVGLFGLSMWRMHRQMAKAKQGHLAVARRLYADAYAPVRAQPTAETLVAQSTALGAARSLEERASDLPTWPIDDATLRFVAVIVTGVVTSLVVRALFAAIGF